MSLGVAGHRAQQPRAPRERLFLVTGVQQRDEHERRVAQPAVAVVPVAHAAELLGKRGGGRGEDGAGARVGQRLEREQRADHDVAPGPVVAARARPLAPEHVGAAQRGDDVGRPGLHFVRREVRHLEPDPLARTHPELRDRRQVLAVQLDVGVERERVRSGDGDDRPGRAMDPRHDAARSRTGSASPIASRRGRPRRSPAAADAASRCRRALRRRRGRARRPRARTRSRGPCFPRGTRA